MEYNKVSPFMDDPSYWNQTLNNNNYLGEGMRLELNQENVNILNSAQYPSSNEDMLDDGDISMPYKYAANESISSSSSPSGVLNSNLNTKSNGIFSPVSVSEDKKKPKSKKQLLNEQDAILIAKDDSELNEEELQMKRKAQNRAAQRAFRERKETKLKELECKLAESEAEKRRLLSQLDLMKQQNVSILTENEFLKNKSSSDQNLSNKAEDTNVIFPKNQKEFIYGLAGTHEVNTDTINKVYDNPERPGTKLLAVGAVWDYLQLKSQENEKYENLDILEIMSCLKGNERCHGYGPAYPLELVEQIIDQCSVLQ
ncbi:uncharacterized protein AC631_05827 [Debaryomyces fabryi]|uniref:BZIP domain-containing protein n=1 Tax=Debaryomyces fabryi TaxID=58627 RepID=A0A0V1PQI0_9ASCO|nr:uncharacterized protein AC631_05827 [Debaryomyces fabryi]KRZ98415.1 hypothetical protein AC631_05827 [Debaryomyces fabryi]CUM46336.1 unnamed protein product [Debaryomyces fabryi]